MPVSDSVSDFLAESEKRSEHMELYWQASVREYWLVDARGDEPSFDIFRYKADGFELSRKRHSWVRSGVLGKLFRLSVESEEFGNPDYLLESR